MEIQFLAVAMEKIKGSKATFPTKRQTQGCSMFGRTSKGVVIRKQIRLISIMESVVFQYARNGEIVLQHLESGRMRMAMTKPHQKANAQ
jgi:hypothetical protein